MRTWVGALAVLLAALASGAESKGAKGRSVWQDGIEALMEADRRNADLLEQIIDAAAATVSGQSNVTFVNEMNEKLDAVCKRYEALRKQHPIGTLAQTATIPGEGDLVVGGGGLQWRGVTGGRVTDITVNGSAWRPKWVGTPRGVDSDVFPLKVGEIVDWTFQGKVEIRRVSPEKDGADFHVTRKEAGAQAFSLEIRYRRLPLLVKAARLAK